jgi:aromatic ring-opening dioxygenase LigB subunit
MPRRTNATLSTKTSIVIERQHLTLVYACIAPHGSEAIAKLASKSTVRRFQKTRDGLSKLAKDIKKARPDTIIIATPHNLKIWGKLAVVTAENCTGTLQASPRNKRTVHLKVKCDRNLANKILETAIEKKLPVVGANYGTSEGSTSDLPMDWGTLVPLWFVIPECRLKPKVVIVTPSREIPLTQNFQFGKVIGQVSERNRKRIAFVASTDQAHRHRKSGPYGYNKASKAYDKFVVDAIQHDRIKSIMQLKAKFVDAARPDSLWQMTILAGVIDKVRMKAELISYDAPTYFGMICASFQRNR